MCKKALNVRLFFLSLDKSHFGTNLSWMYFDKIRTMCGQHDIDDICLGFIMVDTIIFLLLCSLSMYSLTCQHCVFPSNQSILSTHNVINVHSSRISSSISMTWINYTSINILSIWYLKFGHILWESVIGRLPGV